MTARLPVFALMRREHAACVEMHRIWHTEKRDITDPAFLASYTRTLRRAARLKTARQRLMASSSS